MDDDQSLRGNMEALINAFVRSLGPRDTQRWRSGFAPDLGWEVQLAIFLEAPPVTTEADRETTLRLTAEFMSSLDFAPPAVPEGERLKVGVSLLFQFQHLYLAWVARLEEAADPSGAPPIQ